MKRTYCRLLTLKGITLFLVPTLSSLCGQTAYDAIHIMEREMGFGSRALAMGGAYVSLADDYTALYWNPAAWRRSETELSSASLHISISRTGHCSWMRRPPTANSTIVRQLSA